jgi:hypothetical protein
MIEIHHSFPQFLLANVGKPLILGPDNFFPPAYDSSFKYRVRVSGKLPLVLDSTVILGSGTYGTQDRIFLSPDSEC